MDFEKRKYFGGVFDFMGFLKGVNLEELKLKEIKNGKWEWGVVRVGMWRGMR